MPQALCSSSDYQKAICDNWVEQAAQGAVNSHRYAWKNPHRWFLLFNRSDLLLGLYRCEHTNIFVFINDPHNSQHCIVELQPDPWQTMEVEDIILCLTCERVERQTSNRQLDCMAKEKQDIYKVQLKREGIQCTSIWMRTIRVDALKDDIE